MLRPWYLIFDWLWSITPSAREMERIFEWSNYRFFAHVILEQYIIFVCYSVRNIVRILNTIYNKVCFQILQLKRRIRETVSIKNISGESGYQPIKQWNRCVHSNNYLTLLNMELIFIHRERKYAMFFGPGFGFAEIAS